MFMNGHIEDFICTYLKGTVLSVQILKEYKILKFIIYSPTCHLKPVKKYCWFNLKK